jgi:DNA-binding NarL/FixJ family response regulator
MARRGGSAAGGDTKCPDPVIPLLRPNSYGSAMASVLIVDDTRDIRSVLRDYLTFSEAGLEVVGEAADGIEGVEQAARLQPDWVVLDWEMPRKNGIDALPRILEASPRSKVVMFSSLISPGASDAALATGAVAFMEKGGSLEDLVRFLSEG